MPRKLCGIIVRSGKGTVRDSSSFTDEVDDEICRLPKQHEGWKSVTYKGKRYILRGGFRTPLFITLSQPIKKR